MGKDPHTNRFPSQKNSPNPQKIAFTNISQFNQPRRNIVKMKPTSFSLLLLVSLAGFAISSPTAIRIAPTTPGPTRLEATTQPTTTTTTTTELSLTLIPTTTVATANLSNIAPRRIPDDKVYIYLKKIFYSPPSTKTPEKIKEERERKEKRKKLIPFKSKYIARWHNLQNHQASIRRPSEG